MFGYCFCSFRFDNLPCSARKTVPVPLETLSARVSVRVNDRVPIVQACTHSRCSASSGDVRSTVKQQPQAPISPRGSGSPLASEESQSPRSYPQLTLSFSTQAKTKNGRGGDKIRKLDDAPILLDANTPDQVRYTSRFMPVSLRP